MESPDINLSFFDNVNNKVVDNLRLTVGKGSKVSIAAACKPTKPGWFLPTSSGKSSPRTASTTSSPGPTRL